EVGRQRAYLHLTVVYPDAAEPQYSYRREIENQQHQGEQGRHPATDEEAHVGEFTVGLTEPRLLMRLADESPDDADAADLLSHHLVDPVDALLHLPEAGDHAPDDEPDTACQQRHSNRHQPRQADVLAQGHEDAADHHDRGRHQHREGHEQQHLYLLYIVGAAGQQGGSTERGDLATRERRDLRVHT